MNVRKVTQIPGLQNLREQPTGGVWSKVASVRTRLWNTMKTPLREKLPEASFVGLTLEKGSSHVQAKHSE